MNFRAFAYTSTVPLKDRKGLKWAFQSFYERNAFNCNAAGLLGIAAGLGCMVRLLDDKSQSPMRVEMDERTYLKGRMFIEDMDDLPSVMRVLEDELDPSERLLCMGQVKRLPNGTVMRSLRLGGIHMENNAPVNVIDDLGLEPSSECARRIAADPKAPSIRFALFSPSDLQKAQDKQASRKAAEVAGVKAPPSYLLMGTAEDLSKLNPAVQKKDEFLTYLQRDAAYAIGLCVLRHGTREVQFNSEGVQCMMRRSVDDVYNANPTNDNDPSYVVSLPPTSVRAWWMEDWGFGDSY
eukprot:TRINITY_DN12557_c0_g1_i1.p1 TRINITY_DN12557_c0_g1~~TRINITY_DN12557_c0_g1_i1.p1  ORF type:complete len:294 (+),score=26.60 TRINITY_DN12557_c0_g1_i1:663-1544(+)